jgi:hypothetical protein
LIKGDVWGQRANCTLYASAVNKKCDVPQPSWDYLQQDEPLGVTNFSIGGYLAAPKLCAFSELR